MMLTLRASPTAHTLTIAHQNLGKSRPLAPTKTRFSSTLTYAWPQLDRNVSVFSRFSPPGGFIAKTLFSFGRCFLPSCPGAGNYGCSGRVVRGDRLRLLETAGVLKLLTPHKLHYYRIFKKKIYTQSLLFLIHKNIRHYFTSNPLRQVWFP